MPAKKKGRTQNPIKTFKFLKHAKKMPSTSVRYEGTPSRPYAVNIKSRGHWIRVGKDGRRYYLVTSLASGGSGHTSIWNKYGLTRSEVEKQAMRALSGSDLGEVLKKRLRKR